MAMELKFQLQGRGRIIMEEEVKLTSRFSQKRNKLKDVIPIKTPYEIGFFIGDVCNLKCHYCVHSLAGEAHKSLNLTRTPMTMETFKKYTDSLMQFQDKIKVVQFASLGEPTLNPLLPEFVSSLKRQANVEQIKVVTNAIAIDDNLSDRLLEAGVDRFEISIQGYSEDLYEKNAGVKINFDNFISHLSYLYKNKGDAAIYMQCLSSCLPEDEDKEKFLNTFKNVCDYINIAPTVPVDDEVDYSEYIDVDEAIYNKYVNICPQIFYEMFCLSDGTVIPCCHSIRGKQLSIGNIYEESLFDIWNGRKRQELLLSFLRGGDRKKINACKTCISPSFSNEQYDRLDDYRDELIKRLEK